MDSFFVTIPHSGEDIPNEVTWLKGLPERVVMCDVDRFVDQLYRPALGSLGIEAVVAKIHRYVIDLNRLPEDVDQDSVEGSQNPPGLHTTGLHWSQTTTGARLMKNPITRELHDELVKKYFEPFHAQVRKSYQDSLKSGRKMVFQLDAHSMPSLGTSVHRDPGAKRPEIVVSDQDGKSCVPAYKDLVIKSYEKAGFQVAYNWPYKGGRITQTYGHPDSGQSAIQVEMNRNLYMDEITKQINLDLAADVKGKVYKALATIVEGLKNV